MKTTVKLTTIIFLIFTSIFDCNAQNQKVILNTKIAESFISTVDRQNFDSFAALFSDNATYEEVCSGRFYTGKAAIKNYMVATIEGMPDSKFEIVSIVADEKKAVVEWIWKGTNTVGWPQLNLPATDKTMTLKGISIMEIENAKIVKNKDYWDWNSFMKGIGVE